MTDTQSLLAEYARTSSDTAFRELVVRYVNLVYSTARRDVAAEMRAFKMDSCYGGMGGRRRGRSWR